MTSAASPACASLTLWPDRAAWEFAPSPMIQYPPSPSITWPVMPEASGLARKAAVEDIGSYAYQ